MEAKVYNDQFFDEHFAESSRSAHAMLERLYAVIQPKCVADFGCGIGAWLAAAGSLGSEQLFGFDGPWVRTDRLADKRISFSPIDFSGEIALPQRFDLAISVEVAEHLPESNANSFIDTLSRASDVIVFGAAVPGQGGLDHINEQWPSYWMSKFLARGYVPFDFFRPHFWSDARVAWYYRQNTFLYVHSTSPIIRHFGVPTHPDKVVDAVHPTLFALRMRQRDRFWKEINSPTIFDCADVLLNFAKTQVKRAIKGKWRV